MKRADNETESLRVEQRKDEHTESADEQTATPMSLGSMIRGPIGHEITGEERDRGSDDAVGGEEAERRQG